MDAWAVEQQRLHNLATYQQQPTAEKPATPLEIALRVFDTLTPYQQSGWTRPRDPNRVRPERRTA